MGSTFRWDESYESYRYDKFPIRCRRCENNNRKESRMKRTLKTLCWFAKDHAPNYWDIYPKMVTVTLPSEPLDLHDELYNYDLVKESQLRAVIAGWKKFRKYYELIMLGGTYVVEITTKVNFDREKGNWFAPKFHAHIHAVVQMPYLDSKKGLLQAFSESGRKFGLGLVHVKGKPKGEPAYKYYRNIGNYLSKYITKGRRRQNPFGKLIGYRPPPVIVHYGKKSNAIKTTLQHWHRLNAVGSGIYRRCIADILFRSMAFCVYCKSQTLPPISRRFNQQYACSHDTKSGTCLRRRYCSYCFSTTKYMGSTQCLEKGLRIMEGPTERCV